MNWISVEDQLPEPGTNVFGWFLFNKSDDFGIDFVYYTNKKEWIWQDPGCCGGEITIEPTHWMPIPEGPNNEL